MTPIYEFNKNLNTSLNEKKINGHFGNQIIIVDPFKQKVSNDLKSNSKSTNYRVCKLILCTIAVIIKKLDGFIFTYIL